MSEATPTPRPWGVSVLKDHATGQSRDEGAMILSPPPEESRRRIREGEMSFTSVRVALLEASPYTPHPVCLANAALIVRVVNSFDALLSACEAVKNWLVECGNTIQIGTNEECDPWPHVDALNAALALARKTD